MKTLKIPVSLRISDCVLISLTILLLRCGDIESNPGPSMEELIKDLGNKLSKQIGDVSSDMKSLSSRIENIQEQLRRKEVDIDNMKKNAEKIEKRTESIEERLERQDILMRRDNIIVYGLDEGGGGVKAGVETEEELAGSLVSLFNNFDTRHGLTMTLPAPTESGNLEERRSGQS
jgi:TolA-binding protein